MPCKPAAFWERGRTRGAHISSKVDSSRIVSALRTITFASGVMTLSMRFEPSSRTPLRMLISSSLSGSAPVLWNFKRDLSSAFLYMWLSSAPMEKSRSQDIGQAIGAGDAICYFGNGALGWSGLTHDVHEDDDHWGARCADAEAILDAQGLWNDPGGLCQIQEVDIVKNIAYSLNHQPKQSSSVTWRWRGIRGRRTRRQLALRKPH